MKIINKIISESYKPVLLCGTVLQIFLLFFSSLMLDGGTFFSITCVGALAFWVSVILIILRNPKKPTKTDLEYIKYGALLIAVLSHIIVNTIWRIRGII